VRLKSTSDLNDPNGGGLLQIFASGSPEIAPAPGLTLQTSSSLPLDGSPIVLVRGERNFIVENVNVSLAGETGVNAIVIRHYPVSSLPADLRELLGDAQYVTMTIKPEAPAKAADRAELHESAREPAASFMPG
jgi:hypothetical protein